MHVYVSDSRQRAMAQKCLAWAQFGTEVPSLCGHREQGLYWEVLNARMLFKNILEHQSWNGL